MAFRLDSRLLFLIVTGLVCFFCGYPLLVLFGKGLAGGTWSELFASESVRLAFFNTVIVSVGTAVVSTALSLPFSWLLARTDIPASRTLRTLLCLPYAIPPYVGAIAWASLANPTSGTLNLILGQTFLNIYSLPGLIFVETSFLYAFVLLTTLSSLERMDPALEEAARMCGAGPLRVFWNISLPTIWPSILGGALLVFLATAASFGVPALIGTPAGISVLTTRIFMSLKMGSGSGLTQAVQLSLVLLVLALLILLLNQLLTATKRVTTVSGKASRPSLVALGAWRLPAVGVIGVFLFLIFILPLLGLLISALSIVPGIFSLSNFGLEHVRHVLFEMDETVRAFSNSIWLALATSAGVVVLGALIAAFQLKTKFFGRRISMVLASLCYSTPGTVIALALILVFSQPLELFDFRLSLYGSLWLLGIAYGVKYLFFSVRTVSDGLGQIHDSLGEAARMCGAGWLTVLRTVWMPLLKTSLVAAFFLIAMPVLSELTMTVLLYGPGTETLGSVLFQLQEYSNPSGAAVLALVIVLVVLLGNTSVKLLTGGRYGF